MKESVVSVVIPAYNAARTLPVTVKSVLEQSFQDFEIIIVDDGSKDDTLKIAQSIAETDSRIKVISQPNGGVASARNAGIRAAKGKYIALLDADDLWVAHKLERQINVLMSEKDIFAVQSGAFFVNDDLEVLSVRPCVPSQDVLLETLLFQNLPNAMSTTVVERRIFEEIGYFDTSLVIEDWEFMIRLARFCNLKSIKEPLSLYRIHPGNRSKDLGIHIKPGYIVLNKIFEDKTLPASIRKKRNLIYSTFYRMLSGGAFNLGRYAESIKWGTKSIITYPPSLGYIVSLPLRRLQRQSSLATISEEQQAKINHLKELGSCSEEEETEQPAFEKTGRKGSSNVNDAFEDKLA